MQYRKFGKLDFQVSALGFGAMRLPVKEGKVDEAEAIKMIRYGIDHGINYVDTAYVYHDGSGEGILGKALQGGYRDKVKLATKLPSWKIEEWDDFDRYLNEQLARLGVDYLDFYLLHSLNKKNWTKLRDLGVLQWAEEATAQGRFSYLGFSFHDDIETFKEIVDAYPWPMCMIQYNYMDVENQAGREGLLYAAQKGMAVVVMEPLLGGYLSEPPAAVQAVWDRADSRRSPVDWALQWLWDQPEVSTVLSGMSTMEQLKENINSASASQVGLLTVAEQDLFNEARTRYEALTAIPCTGCGYCMPCPQKVNIPDNIANYNDGIRYDKAEAVRSRYSWWQAAFEKQGLFANDIRAASCSSCGECETRCPQNIPISHWMPTIHAVMAEGKPFRLKLDD